MSCSRLGRLCRECQCLTHGRSTAVGVIGRVRRRGGYGRTPPPVSSSIMRTAARPGQIRNCRLPRFLLQAFGAQFEPWRVYQVDDARAFLAEAGVDVDRIAPEVDGKVASAFIRARKPEAKTCCGPTCCS